MTATSYALLPDSQCDQDGYPSDAQMMRDLQAIRRADHARIWQSFVATFDLSAYTAEEIEGLRRWWFLRGIVEDVRRERRGARWRR